jgi:hypothetical protein
MAKKPGGLTARERRALQIKSAMPEVNALVSKHGQKVVAICLYRMQRFKKELARRELLMREIDRIDQQALG